MSNKAERAINRLLARKAKIERRISEELKRPLPCMLTLQSLKRARLYLKDRANRVENVRCDKVVPISVRIA